MTEPVAYIRKTSGGTYISQMPIGDNYGAKTDKTLPLYTEEQLHQRLKMTQAEFETFKNIKQKYNLLSDALNSTAFFGNEKQQSEKQIEFANLFINLDLNNPEETIEIVPNMKWFVRSKEKNGDTYLYLKKPDGFVTPWYTVFKDLARHFDTEEEAELWNNPLTEAVQLAVEGE